MFFVAVPGLMVGESFEFVFSASGVGSGTGTAQWVPEPATVMPVADGLALLARTHRRQVRVDISSLDRAS